MICRIYLNFCTVRAKTTLQMVCPMSRLIFDLSDSFDYFIIHSEACNTSLENVSSRLDIYKRQEIIIFTVHMLLKFIFYCLKNRSILILEF